MDAQELRGLLELAAKAAGIEIEWNVMINHHSPILAPKTQQERNWLGHEHTPWNPLADDGDALRLAEKCGLTVCMDGLGTVSACDERQRKEVFCTQSINECGSRIAATRLAIVRAAAAIGEKMEAKP